MKENYLKENNDDNIIRGSYNSQYQGAIEAFNKITRFFISAKDHQGETLFSWFY